MSGNKLFRENRIMVVQWNLSHAYHISLSMIGFAESIYLYLSLYDCFSCPSQFLSNEFLCYNMRAWPSKFSKIIHMAPRFFLTILKIIYWVENYFYEELKINKYDLENANINYVNIYNIKICKGFSCWFVNHHSILETY